MEDVLCPYEEESEAYPYPEDVDAYEVEELTIEEALFLLFGRKISSPRDMLWA